ncbi:hypothetical protein JGH11_14620 [Dysgonomonas sp. Marseille-P4677]|uniref:DUF6246 family protein n=1 Tax=Dysgonomonas sp. Marseille-P4677 TaxID=2364790 RepID=UPI001914A7EA|nr:DUF6246 family protein [Dysgonomonas sp. Marseille-P4677]MBK5722109.1 hypothetical protein [Dysgonomonas sp. Marseille-P4677]
MKKISLLLLSALMAVCVFTSCSEDDDDKIVGVWKHEGREIADVKVEGDNQEAIAILKNIIEHGYIGQTVTYDFKKDGTFFLQEKYDDDDYVDTWDGKYWFTDDKISLSDINGSDVESYSYSFDGKKTLYLYEDYTSEYANFPVVLENGDEVGVEKLVVRYKYVKQ